MPGLDFTLDADAAAPPYEQLRRHILSAIAAGTLVAEERLPPVRALATRLGLAANTVAHAYRSLEADGVIVTRGRHGSFVAAHGDGAHRRAQQAAAEYARTTTALGLSAEEALALVAASLRAAR